MRRRNVIVACTSEEMAESYADRLQGFCDGLGLSLHVGSGHHSTYKNAHELYDALSCKTALELRRSMLIVEAGSSLAECFAPMFTTAIESPWHTPRSHIGMAIELILRFPQLLIVFVHDEFDWRTLIEGTIAPATTAPPAHVSDDVIRPLAIHFPVNNEIECAISAFADGHDPLFDCTGLRTLLRNRLLGEAFGTRENWSNSAHSRDVLLRRLTRCAVVVDEEDNIANLSAYAMYKHGERAWLVTTYAQFRREEWRLLPNTLILRDLDLRFPDIPLHERELRQNLRTIWSSQWQPALRDDTVARAVSGDHGVEEHVHHTTGWAPDEIRLGEWKAEGNGRFLGFKKPFRSFASIAKLATARPGVARKPLPVVADLKQPAAATSHNHAVPYVNLTIAQQLLEEASGLLVSEEISSLIITAVLALESYSLLLGMSTTAAAEAVRVLELAEAKIESQFMTEQSYEEIADRRSEIEGAVNNLGLGASKRFILGRIWAQLRIVYRESEQFDAAEAANNEVLANRAWFRGPNGAHWRLVPDSVVSIKRGFLRFISSFPAFTELFACWTLILTGLHARSMGYRFAVGADAFRTFRQLWFCSALSLFQEGGFHLADCHEFESSSHLVQMIGAASGFILLGLFLAILFRKITRG